MANSVDTFCQFAISCNYEHHGYLKVDGDNLVATTDKTNTLEEIVNHGIRLLERCDNKSKPLVAESLRIISSHLKDKCSGFIARHFYSERVKVIQAQITRIENAVRALPQVESEEVFKLKFLASLPKQLNVTVAPSGDYETVFNWRDGVQTKRTANEWKMIAWLSKNVFESYDVQLVRGGQACWRAYNEIMLGAYQGDHLLIEDTQDHALTKELYEHGAIVRGCSHYEKGRKIIEWDDKGNPVYASELREDLEGAEVQHFGLTGNHIKHILFHQVDMREQQNGALIAGKTARQVDKLLAADNLVLNGVKVERADVKMDKTRHYVAFQFESSADSEGYNLLDSRFYKHRIAGCLTYLYRKFRNYEKANVGPYGYGYTDQKPVTLHRPAAPPQPQH